jgi:hypothetical protein
MVGRVHNRAGLELVGPENLRRIVATRARNGVTGMLWHRRIGCIQAARDLLRGNHEQAPRRP